MKQMSVSSVSPEKKVRDVMKKKKGSLGVRFELEEDAEAIFREAIEGDEFRPEKVNFVEQRDQKPSKKRHHQAGKRISIDLHGMTVNDAKDHVREQIDSFRSKKYAQVTFRIITGKGIHSGPEGGVLVREIYHYVVMMYRAEILRIDSSPEDTAVGGLPIRGHFDVSLSFKKF